MSHISVNVHPKRRPSDDEVEDINSASNPPKRSADLSNQPRLNETLSQKTLRLSGSLPNLELPNALEKTFIANQIVTLEINQKLHNTMTGKSDDVSKSNYNVPTENQFDLLNAKVNKNNSTNLPAKQIKIKIPPITVVGASNFTKSLDLLNTLHPNADFTIKYMSIGTKIMIKNAEVYNNFKKSLSEADIEFFTHDAQPEKFDRFILSGIPRTPCIKIKESLDYYQMEPSEIREFNQKAKKFEEEGSYIVSFIQGTVKIQNLQKTVIDYTVPKWRPYYKSTNNITQCRRCQQFGHGQRNCFMKFKCATCGLDHPSETCNSPVTKCANCKGDHASTSQSCPKRKEFIDMRSRLAASNNNKKSTKPTPAPRNNLNNFPKLPKSTSTNPNVANDTQLPQLKTADWSSLFNSNSSAKPTTTNKFQLNEIGPIMSEILTGLNRCQNKEQQLILMFEMATKYIYNVGP